MTDKEREFLIKLSALTRETGIIIGGCGCCESPWLEEAKENSLVEGAGYALEGDHDGLDWISPDHWNWENRGKVVTGESK